MKRTAIFFLLCLVTAVLSAQVEITSSSSTSHSGTRIVFNRNGISSFNVEVRGKIELTDDDKDIKSISADGYLEITKTTFGSRRSIVITPDGNGVKREYYEGRDKQDFERGGGRQWLSEILPELVRSTTIGAEGRVARFFRQGGSAAVMSEIQKIDSGENLH